MLLWYNVKYWNFSGDIRALVKRPDFYFHQIFIGTIINIRNQMIHLHILRFYYHAACAIFIYQSCSIESGDVAKHDRSQLCKIERTRCCDALIYFCQYFALIRWANRINDEETFDKYFSSSSRCYFRQRAASLSHRQAWK